MGPQGGFDNNTLANLIFSNNFATREQITQLWQYITPDKNIGILLVEARILPGQVYSQMISYLSQNVSAPGTNPPRKQNTASAPVSNAKSPKPKVSSMQNDQRAANAGVSEPIEQTRTKNTITIANTISEMLHFAKTVGASDLHLSVGNPVILRRYGCLTRLDSGIVTQDTMTRMVKAILTEEQFEKFSRDGDLECVVQIKNAGRFRLAVIKQRLGFDITARCIPDKIRSFEETGMPQSCMGLTQWAQGLVLVTGPASCGKSSTLATLVEMINQTRPDHIITIESPIEYVYTSAKAHITQREVGKSTSSQESALRAALREDPDIIVVGELRDLATIQLAVSAAETGHLVFGTMNTISASRTIYRLIDSFPPEEQSIIRNMISESLRGVISQQLIPRIDSEGMVAAYEVLLVNSAVSNMIRKDEAHQLGTAMITGKASGMQLLDDSIRNLANQGIISQQEAINRCSKKTSGEK